MEQELTKEQYDQILKELREIKQIIMATKKDIRKIEEESREIRENMATKDETAKNKGDKDNREIKDVVENIGDMTDSICGRIDSMCQKMNEAILEAYGMPISPRRRCRNVTRPIYYGEDGINSTRCSSTGY